MPEIRWLLEDARERYGNRPAVITPAETISFAEFDRRVEVAAGELEERGYRAGDRIALLMSNSAEYLVWLLGVIRMGGVACPMNNRLPVRTLPGLLGRIDCRTIIAEDPVVQCEWEGELVFIPSQVPTRALCHDPKGWRAPASLDRPATVLFTSGSAGPPKAVLHSFGNHHYSALGANSNLPLGDNGRWLLDLPLYHVGGLGIVFRCMLAGAAVVIPGSQEALEVALDRYQITHLSVVVTQLYRLLAHSFSLHASLRAVVLGGSPIPLKLLERARTRNLPVFASYGNTEMASQVTTTSHESSEAQRLTAGKLLPYRELRVAEDGEILVRGKTLFLGYAEGRQIRRPFSPGGWFHTGDFGAMDADGYLIVHGRKDNRFFSGGETIYPEEIERVLCEFEGIEQAVVVPVPDEEFGERCVAFLRAEKGCPPGGALSAWLQQTLPKFKVPDAFYEWPQESDPAKLKVDRTQFRRLALREQKRG